MNNTRQLPEWAKEITPVKFEVYAEQFYPAILDDLGVPETDVDQYWLAVAKSVMKMDMRVATAGAPITILIDDGTKTETSASKWALKAVPVGKGQDAGFKDAKDHYKRLRGLLPA